MSKRNLDDVINEKLEKGADRICITVSFKITDKFEVGLLKHLWQFTHSIHIKRLLQRDKEGGNHVSVDSQPIQQDSDEKSEIKDAMKSFL